MEKGENKLTYFIHPGLSPKEAGLKSVGIFIAITLALTFPRNGPNYSFLNLVIAALGSAIYCWWSVQGKTSFAVYSDGFWLNEDLPIRWDELRAVSIQKDLRYKWDVPEVLEIQIKNGNVFQASWPITELEKFRKLCTQFAPADNPIHQFLRALPTEE